MSLTINAGKILQIYALLGLVLLFSHSWKESSLLFLALCLFAINLIISHFSPSLHTWTAVFMIPFSESGIISKGIFSNLLYGSSSWLFGELFSGRFLMEASLFLFGQYVGRKNIFIDNKNNELILQKVVLWGGSLAILTTVAIAFIKIGNLAASSITFQLQNIELVIVYLKVIQQTAMSFFYIAVLVKIYRLGMLKNLLSWLEPAGKMALTTFIIQAVFLLFFEKLHIAHYLGLAGTMAVGLLFFVLQVLFASLWMTHFRQGPVEWLWRTLTYLKWQPVRKKVTHPSSINL